MLKYSAFKVVSHFCAWSLSEILTFHFLPGESRSMSRGLTVVLLSFVGKYLNLYVSKFDLQKVSQAQRVQFSQWGHSISNIKIFISHPVHFYTSSNHFRDIKAKMFDLQRDRGHEYNFRKEAVRWRISKSLKVVTCILTLALTISEITFPIFYLQNVGQGHRVQFSQRGYLMVNIKICKSRSLHFYASSNNFRYITFQIFDMQTIHGIQCSKRDYKRDFYIFYFR